MARISQVINEVVRDVYGEGHVPLHAPIFSERDKSLVAACIDSTFVSSVGEYVSKMETLLAEYVGAEFAVATVNGTAALHLALICAGVEAGDEVVTQSTSFVATANAIAYCGASPVFVDCDTAHLGMAPAALESFFEEHGQRRDDGTLWNRTTGRRIKACVPMHTFGHLVEINKISTLCKTAGVVLVEDSAEALGSRLGVRSAGTFGKLGIFSFNGNKIITTGGGGMVVTDDEHLARKAKHLSTTAKVPHTWDTAHDTIGFNYRMPNLNAALGCAQMEMLSKYVQIKREIASYYSDRFASYGINFMEESEGCESNYWLNALILRDENELKEVLQETNRAGVGTRPLWHPLHLLPAFSTCFTGPLPNTEEMSRRIINIPSGIPTASGNSTFFVDV